MSGAAFIIAANIAGGVCCISSAHADEAMISATVRKIEDLYLEKGFFLVEIDPVVEPVSDSEVVVKFQIKENKKVLVKRINIVGNSALKDVRSKLTGSRLFFGRTKPIIVSTFVVIFVIVVIFKDFDYFYIV